MKIAEKVLLGWLALLFFLQLLNASGWIWFALFSMALGLFYAVGSYWLFKPAGWKQVVLALLTGLALLGSLYSLPYFIRLRRNDAYYYYAAPNAFLFLSVGVYWLVARFKQLPNGLVKPLLVRSGVVFLATALFALTPVTFTPFRKLLMAFNQDDGYLYNNLLLFDYSEKYDHALKTENCSQAIFFGLKALESGKIWLDIKTPAYTAEAGLAAADSVAVLHEATECQKISKAYDNVYFAYKCQAEKLFAEEAYAKSLENFTAGHHYLTACEQERKGWRSEVSWSLVNIAVCQRRLNQSDAADSTFIAALQFYKSEKDVAGTAARISYYADELTLERLFHQANLFFALANKLLLEDSITQETKASVTANSLTMVQNFIQQDSLPEAHRAVKQAIGFAEPGSNSFCRAHLYYAVLLLKQNRFAQADSAAKATLACFKSQPKPVSQNIAECHLLLCHINAAQANYPAARQHLSTGMQLTENNYGTSHVRYAHYLRTLANLEQLTGNYTLAQSLYKRAIGIYNSNPEATGNKAETLSGLAFTELTLSDFEQANAHADSALAMAFRIRPDANTGMTDLLNIAANVDYFLTQYHTAENLYRQVISVNKMSGLKNEITTATALNGLGLIETERRKYDKADSLFLASIELYKTIVTENHPLTANAYLNHSALLLKQNRLPEAEQALAKAGQIYSRFHKPDHDAFGDVLLGKGDLASRRKEPETALGFYRKALAIYSAKFNKQHWKVKHAEEKSAAVL